MRPHEQEWESVPGIEVGLRDIIAAGQETALRDVPERVATLVSAAPDMARALLRFRNAHLGQDSAEEMEDALLDAESALIKAGVPLP